MHIKDGRTAVMNQMLEGHATSVMTNSHKLRHDVVNELISQTFGPDTEFGMSTSATVVWFYVGFHRSATVVWFYVSFHRGGTDSTYTQFQMCIYTRSPPSSAPNSLNKLISVPSHRALAMNIPTVRSDVMP